MTKKFLPTFFDYIFNYKNSLTTNQMGFDTIEINLVIFTKTNLIMITKTTLMMNTMTKIEYDILRYLL